MQTENPSFSRWIVPARSSGWMPYALAVAVTLATLLVRLHMAVSFAERPLLILFVLPIILSAYVGGLGPGLVATATAAVGTDFLLIPPTMSLLIAREHDFIQWLMLILDGALISVLTEALHRSRSRVATSLADLKTTHERLQQATYEMDLVLNNTSEVVAHHDKDRNLLWVNNAYLKATGLALQDIIGKKCYEARGLREPCRGCPVEIAISKGTEQIGELSPDNQPHWPADQGCWMIIAAPVRDGAGTITGAIEIATDITGQRKTERERESLRKQLAQAQKMESIGRLAGGMAHDFNNMLSVILGNTEMALKLAAHSQSLVTNLQEIKTAVDRSVNLTRQLLAFAHIQVVAPRVLNLNEAVETALKMLRRLIGEDIDVVWMPGKNLWHVKMDPAQIDQILANLCANARDSIASVGKVTLETGNVVLDEAFCATCADSTPGEYIMLAVSDNGCGMDASTLEHLYEPFFTTKEVGKGTGLGLATVYGIVKQNKGFITIHSEPGHGTTFRIYMPRFDGQLVVVPESASLKVATGNETILVVEDEPLVRGVTRAMLEDLGYRVLTASAPGEAIECASAHKGRIDLLISDVIMPEMNGREMTKLILASRPEMKLLFMSGYTTNVIAQHGVFEVEDNFIQKPFTLQALATKVRAMLEREVPASR